MAGPTNEHADHDPDEKEEEDEDKKGGPVWPMVGGSRGSTCRGPLASSILLVRHIGSTAAPSLQLAV